MKWLLALLVCVGRIGLAEPASAYKCAVPGLVNPAKKAVCANELLMAANETEQATLDGLTARLPADARRALLRDRRTYLATRDGCRADERCLEAVMRAQIRLYRSMEPCAAASARALFCVTQASERHRQQLHRSM